MKPLPLRKKDGVCVTSVSVTSVKLCAALLIPYFLKLSQFIHYFFKCSFWNTFLCQHVIVEVEMADACGFGPLIGQDICLTFVLS